MLIAQDFIEQGYPIAQVLRVTEIPSSTFYYQPKINPKTRGAKKSTHTRTTTGKYIANSIVVKEIEDLLRREFVDYGYRKVTYWLRRYKKYIINEKKVYRLMKEHKLLNKKTLAPKGTRTWVKELVPKPSVPFEHLEFDIKYIYVNGENRNALLLTVIDVKSRWVLGQLLKWNIGQYDVRKLFEDIFTKYQFPQKMFVRCDNGSQFVAKVVREYFEQKNVIQEFTKPATPEQNAHIESYHSIIERVICQQYDLESLDETQSVFDRWIDFYNFERIHSGIDYRSPAEYLKDNGVIVQRVNTETKDEKNFESAY